MSAIAVLDLGRVELPDWHPRHADGFCPVLAHVVRHPDGAILFDTGVGTGNEFIDDAYRPTVVPVVDALNGAGIDERDVVAIVNSHLHFDHCGQNHALPGAVVHVQPAEVEAASAEFYTVPEWAEIEPTRRRLVDGDEEIAPGVRILATPGHTPGHQSLLVELPDTRPTLLVGQACYCCAEFTTGDTQDVDFHGGELVETGRASLERLRALPVEVAHFSHDPEVWRRE